MAKRRRTAPASASGLSGLSTAEIQRELARRLRKLPALERKLARARAKVAAIEAQISDMGVTPRGRNTAAAGVPAGRRRFKNDSNLVDALAGVLKGKTMGVTEAAEAVVKAGYKTTAANFRTMVNQALIKFKDRFKKVSRGQYTAA